MPLGNLFAGLFWVGLSLLVFRGISSLPATEAGAIGPASFPRILAFSLLGLTIVYLFQSRKEKKAALFEGGRAGIVKSALLAALAFGTATFWEKIGALPALVLISCIELKWIEGYGWKKALAIGITLSAGIWLIFTQLLGVNLPLGILLWLFY